MVQTYCFVCGAEVGDERDEETIPWQGGMWVFVVHWDCRAGLDRTLPARFHEMALSALGHPRAQ